MAESLTEGTSALHGGDGTRSRDNGDGGTRADGIPSDRERAGRLARNLRAIADPTRVQLLTRILARPDGRALVGQLAEELALSQPTVSHHMRILTAEGVLVREKAGRVAWYSVAADRVADLEDALAPAAGSADAVDPAVLDPAALDHAVLDPAALDPALLGPAVLDPAVLDPTVRGRIIDDLVARFRGVLSPQTVERYVDESRTLLDRRGARLLPSLTARFAAERLDALAEIDEPRRGGVPRVLFVCVENAGRSQMAAAILQFLAGDRVHVFTAGSAPAAVVNPRVVTALDEIGIPVTGAYPKPLTDEVVRAADVVVTMGCGDACPVYPGRRYLDWDLADPSGLALAGVRAVRDDIDLRVRSLLEELGGTVHPLEEKADE